MEVDMIVKRRTKSKQKFVRYMQVFVVKRFVLKLALPVKPCVPLLQTRIIQLNEWIG